MRSGSTAAPTSPCETSRGGWSSAPRWRARSSTIRPCCFSTSRARDWIRRPAELLEPLVGRPSGPDAGAGHARHRPRARRGRPRAGPAPGPQRARRPGRRRAARGDQGALPVIGHALAILRKDLLLETARRRSVPAMTLFAVTAFVLFHFGLDRNTLEGDLASGVVWVTLLLATVIGVVRLFAAEREQGALDGAAARPDRPHRAVPREGDRAVPVPRRCRAGRGPGVRAAAARARAWAARSPSWSLISCWPTSASPRSARSSRRSRPRRARASWSCR